MPTERESRTNMPILERASAEAAGIADELRGAPRNQQGNNDTDDLIG